MTEIKFNVNEVRTESENHELACGNCWGHQQYEQGYREKKFEYWRGRKDNFISRFVKKYLK